MATPVLARIGELLAGIAGHGTFATRVTADADDLHVEVRGVGRLRFPVSRAQAKRLCGVARPARYGRGEETLLDERVRDTSKIPKSRVNIDARRWKGTLLPVLDRVRRDLGLPEGCTLKAELHSMLVYAPGQFFLPHQDSEKSDEMIGTLVVTLPSSFRGGALAVEHKGKRLTYRGSKERLHFVAFYADCHHEVKPVKDGYRIVLTYNLMVGGEAAGGAGAYAHGANVHDLAGMLREHFETPVPPPRWVKDDAPRDRASRLVYLLDHQYTERGLGWRRLKGDDAARAAALRAAAEAAGCDVVLALADVHETWECVDDDWYEPRYGRSRRWEWGNDDEWHTDYDPPDDDPDRYDLVDLLDWCTTLDRWMAPGGQKPEAVSTQVYDHEVCTATPSVNLQPYASEYEGYMGNYGNTMDRWYRRAAIVLWPRDRAFAVRAEASPPWAIKELSKLIREGSLAEAQEKSERLLPFWETVAERELPRGFIVKVLAVADGLDWPDSAAALLRPFRVQDLTPRNAPAFVALVKRYGDAWTQALLAEWSDSARAGWAATGWKDQETWLGSLPRLAEAMTAVDDGSGSASAKLLLEDQWRWLRQAIRSKRGPVRPSWREEALRELSAPMLAFLEATAVAKAGDLADAALTWLCADDNEELLPCLVDVLRLAERPSIVAAGHWPGLDRIRRRCLTLLEARLATRPRDEGDWSIKFPGECGCELCGTLSDFLSDSHTTQLEWPIAKEKRKHVHGMIDAYELPVRHATRRSGSPYTLVLTKTRALFDEEAAQRRSWRADLDRLRGRRP